MSVEERKTPITVGELIAELQKMPQDLPVMTQGCDCEGWSDGAIEAGDCVIIGRDDSLRPK